MTYNQICAIYVWYHDICVVPNSKVCDGVLDVYIHELKRFSSMAPCDDTLKTFVLQDFVPGDGVLKVNLLTQDIKSMILFQTNSFVFVSRTSKYFDGTAQYVMWCSCDQQRALLADALPAINTECLTTFEELRPPCMHIKAARHILMEVDGVNDISPELDFSGN